jgi:hypothetical protein
MAATAVAENSDDRVIRRVASNNDWHRKVDDLFQRLQGQYNNYFANSSSAGGPFRGTSA